MHRRSNAVCRLRIAFDGIGDWLERALRLVYILMWYSGRLEPQNMQDQLKRILDRGLEEPGVDAFS